MKVLPRTHNAGFSLVEVTLALGIAALGIIAVLGLMPQGMEMSRKTGQLSIQRQITEHVARDLEQKSWADLISVPETTLFFDDQGLEVTANSPVLSFVAQVEIVNTGTMMLPQGAVTEPFLRKVLIRIANSPRPQFDFDDPRLNRQFVTMVHFVAKSG